MTTPSAQVQPSTRVRFRVVPGVGHCVLGSYVEEHWLPVLGPTCYCLARRVVDIGKDDYGMDIVHTYGPLAMALGVSPAKVRDAIKRLRRFGPVTLDGIVYVVPNCWPDAPEPKEWPR